MGHANLPMLSHHAMQHNIRHAKPFYFHLESVFFSCVMTLIIARTNNDYALFVAIICVLWDANMEYGRATCCKFKGVFTREATRDNILIYFFIKQAMLWTYKYIVACRFPCEQALRRKGNGGWEWRVPRYLFCFFFCL